MTAPDFQTFNDDAISRMIGVKYVICGDTLNGMDCSGLVKYVHSLMGVELENVLFSGEIYTHKAVLAEFKKELANGDWVQLDQPEHGCLVAISHCKIVNHCGIWLNGDRILHSAQGVGVHISPERTLRMQKAYKYTFHKWHQFT